MSRHLRILLAQLRKAESRNDRVAIINLRIRIQREPVG